MVVYQENLLIIAMNMRIFFKLMQFEERFRKGPQPKDNLSA